MPNEPHAVETSGPVTPPPMPSAPGAVKGAATAVAPPFAKASPRALDRSSAWLKWRLNRLRCMTPAEISHRVVRTLSAHAERAGLLVDEGMPEPALDNAPVAWVHSGARVEPAGYLAAADRIASGRLDVFALSGVELGSPPRWNRDPRTGVEAPLTFGKLLDYRDPRRVGDIKYLWEVNRHLHIVTLAQAYALSGDPRYFAVIREHIESWLESCPVGLGPNWSSSLEVSIRLINWSVAWQFLGGALSPMFRDRDGAQFRRK